MTMMLPIKGRKMPKQTLFSKAFFWRCSFLLLLLCSNGTAWHQRRSIQQHLRPKQHHNGMFHSATRTRPPITQSNSLPSPLRSFTTSYRNAFYQRSENMKASFSKHTENDSHHQNWKMVPRQRNTKLGRAFLRRILPTILLFGAAAILCPTGAFASTARAATPVVAPAATPAPIIVCPVSAATEFRLMLRLVIAALIGAVLGKERSFAKHSAGVRTMSLVSMGAAVFTVCSGYGFANFPKVDASRMAANVASGVGFVGAGVITTSMRNQDKGNPNNPQNNVVHGLTTAATIWLSAAVGVACGVGLLRVATTAAFSTVVILRLGRKKKKRISVIDYHTIQQQQRNRSSRLGKNGGNPIRRKSDVNVDDDGDIDAEIHVTTHWDEHHEHEPDEVPKNSESCAARPRSTTQASEKQHREKETEIKQEKIDQLYSLENLNSTLVGDHLIDPSKLMEEIVRSAWKNDNTTVTALVDIVLNRVEQRDRTSKLNANARDDHSSSSDSEYRP